VFEAARLFELEKVVWISTAGVFGPAERHKQEFVSDNALHHSVGVYTACKSLNEYMAHHYHDVWAVSNTGLRFGVVFGLGRMRGVSSFGTEIIRKAALGQPQHVPFADAIPTDWLHVEDAAQAVVLASEFQNTDIRTFNVVGEFASVGQVVAIIKDLLPDAPITLSPGLLSGFQFAKSDGKAFEIQAGFEPKYTLQEGIRQTINAYRKRVELPLV
jgi:nucleoside-diphosphate-sugar epimerase